MTVFEKLKERLAPVKIYDSEAQALGCELKAYAAELERLYVTLNALFRERFITTAMDEGLRVYERLFGPERSGESAEDRREKLLLRMNLGNGDFTPAGIRRALDSFGFDCTVSEYPALGRMDVTAVGDCTRAQREWISREVGKIIPAHIDFRLTFNTLTWSQWDALDRCWLTIDAADETWNQIDSRMTQ